MSGFFGGGGTAYSNFTGSSTTVTGSSGLVPAPAAGDQSLYLRGDGTFKSIEGLIFARQSSYTHNVGAVNGSSVAFWTFPWSNGGSAGTIGTLICFFCPILIPKQDTYTRLAFTVNVGAASSSAGVALYTMDESTGYPKDKLFSSASGISTTNSGTYEETISLTLSAGWYYGALLASTNTTLAFRAENNMWLNMFGASQPWNGTNRNSLKIRMTTARSSVTDFPFSITSSDLTIGNLTESVGGVGGSMPYIGIRKV
jgi:hypothetical protein